MAQRPVSIINGVKHLRCAQCGEMKPGEAFPLRCYVRGMEKYESYCIPCRVANNRKKYLENPLVERHKMRCRHVKRTYGISWDEMIEMVKKAGGCAICGNELDFDRTKSFAVDHCHTTGKVRGVLCYPCNQGLGLFRDKPENLIKAAAYIERSREIE